MGALATAAATHFDIDHDGDLDPVTHPVNGAITFFRNNAQSGQAIRFVPQDHVGNRDGIGARVTIAYDGGKAQMREIQLGGGFMSFDAPVAHFELGAADTVERLVIRWRDGSETVVSGPREAGREYVVTRGGGLKRDDFRLNRLDASGLKRTFGAQPQRGIKGAARRASPARPHASAIWLMSAHCSGLLRTWLPLSA